MQKVRGDTETERKSKGEHMTKDEALKLALKQLDFFDRSSHQHGCVWQKHLITAIKEALAQPEQEYDYKDLYEKEKRRSAMWLAKYEEIAGPAPCAVPMAQPEQDDRRLKIALRQWEDWKTYALELQKKLVKYEGGSPMILNTQPQEKNT